MTMLKKRRADLRKEKKARTAARAAVPKKGPVPKKDPDGSWLDFRDLANEKLEAKLSSIPYDDMLTLYKKLERESGFRIDPENYKPNKIVKNFMTLWTRKIDDEKRAATDFEKHGEKLIPLTADEVDQVMSDRGRSSGIAPLHDPENDEPF